MRHMDMTGKRVGRLTVLERAEHDRHGHIVYRCKCDCGSETYVCSSSLTHGHTLSCGCYQADCARKALSQYKERRRMEKHASRNRVVLTHDDIASMSRNGLDLSPGVEYRITDVLDVISAKIGRMVHVDMRYDPSTKRSAYCVTDSDSYGLSVSKGTSECLMDAVLEFVGGLRLDNLI